MKASRKPSSTKPVQATLGERLGLLSVKRQEVFRPILEHPRIVRRADGAAKRNSRRVLERSARANSRPGEARRRRTAQRLSLVHGLSDERVRADILSDALFQSTPRPHAVQMARIG